MTRRTFLTGLGLAAVAITAVARPGLAGRIVLAQLAGRDGAQARSAVEPWAAKLVAAAESQIGVTVTYDPAYVRLAYPGGDVPRDRGVCTDVVVRAYRDAFGLDLQQLVHADMTAHFRAYPSRWGLKRPDSHIDHRRVDNLRTFFSRKGAALAVSRDPADYAPGDLVTMMVGESLPHIAVVSSRRGEDGARPLIVHNIGAGTRAEDRLLEFPLTGHYRFRPPGA